jgi:hypothetical protein
MHNLTKMMWNDKSAQMQLQNDRDRKRLTPLSKISKLWRMA